MSTKELKTKLTKSSPQTRVRGCWRCSEEGCEHKKRLLHPDDLAFLRLYRNIVLDPVSWVLPKPTKIAEMVGHPVAKTGWTRHDGNHKLRKLSKIIEKEIYPEFLERKQQLSFFLDGIDAVIPKSEVDSN